jgi:hypothetical protein
MQLTICRGSGKVTRTHAFRITVFDLLNLLKSSQARVSEFEFASDKQYVVRLDIGMRPAQSATKSKDLIDTHPLYFVAFPVFSLWVSKLCSPWMAEGTRIRLVQNRSTCSLRTGGD